MKTHRTLISTVASWLIVNALSLAIASEVRAQGATPATTQTAGVNDPRLDQLQQEVHSQTVRMEWLRQALVEQEERLAALQRALDQARLDETQLGETRARGPQDRAAAPPSASGGVPAAPLPTGSAAQQQGQPPGLQQHAAQQMAQEQPPQQVAQQQRPQPVGRPPEEDSRPPAIAQIFEQPGVLTPRGKFVVEPSLQFGYSASDRVALVGYTVIPALLIGLIDVRQVKTTTGIATLTGRYGLTNRLEVEAKVPYVYVNGDTVSREIFTGSAMDNVFNAHGEGLGDVEVTARYQLNDGGVDKPYYIGWLRYKARTGTDIFEVVTDCVTRCVGNTTGTGLPLELPTGSGFASIQPGLTWLYASDPVVFFGSFSYLHNFKREGVSRTVIGGTTEFIGDVEAGDIYGFNLGMGLALNEQASISIGYDQSIVGKIKQNGVETPNSVQIVLGTLNLGASYRFNQRTTMNVALGVGVTRDTPDLTLTVRVPNSF